MHTFYQRVSHTELVRLCVPLALSFLFGLQSSVMYTIPILRQLPNLIFNFQVNIVLY